MTGVRPSLHKYMADRRKELGISVSAAARAAGVARSTWIGWESGVRTPYDSNYAAIENVLKWERRSVETILAGGAPTPIEDIDEPIDEFERRLRETISVLPPDEQANFIALYRAQRATKSAKQRPESPVRTTTGHRRKRSA